MGAPVLEIAFSENSPTPAAPRPNDKVSIKVTLFP
jgi:hypothetical protein